MYSDTMPITDHNSTDHNLFSPSHFPALENATLVAAIESASVGVAVSDPRLPDNPVVYVNSAFRTMTGYTPEDVVGRNCRFLQGPDTDPGAVTRIREAIAGRRDFREILLNYTKDGQPFWNELHITPVFGEGGELTHFVGFQMDVTARVKAEEASRVARAEAERANLAKSDFLSRMSHELRTPLNAILGFAQLMELDETGEIERDHLSHIIGAGRHLLSLIDEVLDIARVEAGQINVEINAVNLGELLHETVALVGPLAAQRGIQWKMPPLKEKAIVQADPRRLQQVLLNLLSNAVKYNCDSGQIRLDYRYTDDRRGPCWTLQVEDTGAGIPPEKRDRLFRPFERLGAEQGTVQGTGLGLALSKNLVEAMNGELTLAPWQGGQGSSFLLTLPAAPSPQEKTESEPSTTSDVAKSQNMIKRQRVLYIEDDLSNYELLRAVLGRSPEIELLAAKLGHLGLEMAFEQHPSLILLDLDLPDTKGEEILRQLKADKRTAAIPVVIVSADAMPQRIEALLQAGAREYFTKPLEVRPFLAAVQHLLNEVDALTPLERP